VDCSQGIPGFALILFDESARNFFSAQQFCRLFFACSLRENKVPSSYIAKTEEVIRLVL